MSDIATDNNEQTTTVESLEDDTDQSQTFDAEYVTKLRKENGKYRQEARNNAAAAQKLAELENANKSEAEKVADRIAKAEAEVASIPAKVAEALKAHLITLHQIDADDAELFLTADEPDLLLKQVARLTERTDKRRSKHVVPREGQNPQAATSDMREFTRNLFNGGNQ